MSLSLPAGSPVGHTPISPRVDGLVAYPIWANLDDAAEKAFDKVGKMLGFRIPPVDQSRLPWAVGKAGKGCIKFPRPHDENRPGLDSVFSGFETLFV